MNLPFANQLRISTRQILNLGKLAIQLSMLQDVLKDDPHLKKVCFVSLHFHNFQQADNTLIEMNEYMYILINDYTLQLYNTCNNLKTKIKLIKHNVLVWNRGSTSRNRVWSAPPPMSNIFLRRWAVHINLALAGKEAMSRCRKVGWGLIVGVVSAFYLFLVWCKRLAFGVVRWGWAC